MKTNQFRMATAMVAAALIAGCASPNNAVAPASQYQPSNSNSYQQSNYSSYGVVDSIKVVRVADGNSGMGGGAVVGGVIGGVLGNQVGGGSGRTAATIVGAVGGALVGNQVQRSNQAHDAYQVGIRLDNGGYETFTLDSVSDMGVGSRVRIENGRVYRY